MGLRFRKSINLGGGARINLSKSGVGFSAGTKGYRYTKTATGRDRTTVSIPGTGISYVEESGKSTPNAAGGSDLGISEVPASPATAVVSSIIVLVIFGFIGYFVAILLSIFLGGVAYFLYAVFMAIILAVCIAMSVRSVKLSQGAVTLPDEENMDTEDIAGVPSQATDDAKDPAAEIAKYKSLLDSGAITQEEYDAKKKQLLEM